MARRHRRKSEERALARRRIARLFELAHRRVQEGEPDLADRSVRLARRIAMRYQTGLLPHERDRFCRTCSGYLAPGASARVRVVDSVRRITCLRCGSVQRRPYRREQRLRRAAARLARGERATRPEALAPLPEGDTP